MFQVGWEKFFLLHLEEYLCGAFLGLKGKSGVSNSQMACTLIGWYLCETK